jgi:hypothetical protein
MRKSLKLASALGIAGLAFVGSVAFTGTGVTNTAGSSQFIGGTVSQTVTGATLTNIVYGFTDTTDTAVNQVTLTFADGTGAKTPELSLTGGTQATFTCTAIDPTLFTSTCTAATGTSQTGVTSANITVS